jgi:hypothetical protein
MTDRETIDEFDHIYEMTKNTQNVGHYTHNYPGNGKGMRTISARQRKIPRWKKQLMGIMSHRVKRRCVT